MTIDANGARHLKIFSATIVAYRGTPGQTFQAAIENIDAPADLGYDTKRNRLLIPHFMESRVTIHPVQ